MSCRGIRINCAAQTRAGRGSLSSLQQLFLPPGTAVVCPRYIRAAWSDQQHGIIRCSIPPNCRCRWIHPDLFQQFQQRLPNKITVWDVTTHFNGKSGLKTKDYRRRMGRYPGSSKAVWVAIRCIKIKASDCLKCDQKLNFDISPHCALFQKGLQRFCCFDYSPYFLPYLFEFEGLLMSCDTDQCTFYNCS